jgi:hypothetical protein
VHTFESFTNISALKRTTNPNVLVRFERFKILRFWSTHSILQHIKQHKYNNTGTQPLRNNNTAASPQQHNRFAATTQEHSPS